MTITIPGEELSNLLSGSNLNGYLVGKTILPIILSASSKYSYRSLELFSVDVFLII
jgi:hypothetical protein